MNQQFTDRKKDHLRLSLLEENEAKGSSLLDHVRLIPDSLPQLNLDEVKIGNPFFIAGMTAGHEQATAINFTLAKVAAQRGWLMGVGSQRRELEQKNYADSSVVSLREKFPALKLMANFGITQLAELSHQQQLSKITEIAERMQVSFIAIHLNPLQEAIQTEGTPHFRGTLAALKNLIEISKIPVVVKETGSGMSLVTLKKLTELKLAAVDVSGLGGTHWGRIEGARAPAESISRALGETFQNWGISTVESVLNAKETLLATTEIWATGGVRSGLDAAKLFALGATRVGFAKPALEAAMQGEAALDTWMQKIEQALKVALFCTNSAQLSDLDRSKVQLLSTALLPMRGPHGSF
jgi:isopentenyl-diphosphate delta-isomerase